MLGFGRRANLASASASASAPGCRPILRKKKCSRLRRELLQVQAEKLAYVSSALFGPYACLGNLTTSHRYRIRRAIWPHVNRQQAEFRAESWSVCCYVGLRETLTKKHRSLFGLPETAQNRPRTLRTRGPPRCPKAPPGRLQGRPENEPAFPPDGASGFKA